MTVLSRFAAWGSEGVLTGHSLPLRQRVRLVRPRRRAITLIGYPFGTQRMLTRLETAGIPVRRGVLY